VSDDLATAPALDRLRRARVPQEAVMHWLRRLAPLLLVAFAAAALSADPGPGLTGRALLVSLAAIAFPVGVLGGNAAAARPRSIAHLACVGLALAGGLILMVLQPDGPGSVCVLVGVQFMARLLPAPASIPFLVTAFAIIEAVGALAGQTFGNLAVLAAFAAFYGMLILAYRLAGANREAERLLSELRDSQAARAQAAGLAERQRLAREMHDVLAHSLSGLILQLEGARMLAAEDPADPRLPQAIERAHHLGRSGLDEARRAIGMLRDDELPGPERLPGLAAQFQEDAAVPCELTVSGEAYPLGSEARVAVYRVAQEALTNIRRHARPARVELCLVYGPRATRLVVEDFADRGTAGAGQPTRSIAGEGGGYGLTGMRERAELLGGTLITESTPRGFRVELDVPA
jgi:signal transduction histidine kinase